MFNLDEQIAQWRQTMIAAGIKAPALLNELESHLREDVEQQLRSGSGAQEAFESASKRIGNANLIKNELEKVSMMKEIREQKLGSIFLLAAGLLYSLFVINCIIFKFGSFASSRPAEQALSLAALAFTILLGVSAFFIPPFLPVIPDQRIRKTICVLSGVAMSLWLVIFYHFVLMHFNFTLSQLVVACLWAMSPIGAFSALVIGLDKAAFKGNRI